MTNLPVKQPEPSGDDLATVYLRTLEADNRLLIDQLQVVQEELERLNCQPKVMSSHIPFRPIQIVHVDDYLIKALAENLRHQALLKAQTAVHDLQARYALSGQLGDILIKGVRSTGALFSVPGRLHQAWRQNRRVVPPAALGGKSFDRVIEAYQRGGDDQVQALLDHASVSSAVQASAWTAVARTLTSVEPATAAALAHRAFALEPRGFRQKWLAFRLHEAGELLEAEALFTLLPSEVQFTDSEARQRDRMLKEASKYREMQARRLHDVEVHQAHARMKWEELNLSRDAFAATVEQQRGQINSLLSDVQDLGQKQRSLLALTQELREQSDARQRELTKVIKDRNQHKEFAAQQQERAESMSEQMLVHRDLLQQEQQVLERAQQRSVMLEEKVQQLEKTVFDLREESQQWSEQSAILQTGLIETTQDRDEVKAQLREQQERVESLLLQLEALAVERSESNESLLQSQQVCASLRLEVSALKSMLDEQAVLVARSREHSDSLQSKLIEMTQARDEQADLAAQRQGELSQQASNRQSIEQARILLESRIQQIETLLTSQAESEASVIHQLSNWIASLPASTSISSESLEGMFKKQAEELSRVRRHVELAIKNSNANTVRQVQSFVGMQEYFATGVLPAFNSEGHSWPVSADFALCLMQQLVLHAYDLVIEFGSGMSTVIVAKTLALVSERKDIAQTPFVSFEHLESYCQQTLRHLQQADLDQVAHLILAPLVEWRAPNDQIYQYYDCHKALTTLAHTHARLGMRILVIVDGPPAATGPRARYPAGPLLLQYFPDAHIDFLMDDYIREDEKEVAQQWLVDAEVAGLVATARTFKFEKDACLITVHPKELK